MKKFISSQVTFSNSPVKLDEFTAMNIRKIVFFERGAEAGEETGRYFSRSK